MWLSIIAQGPTDPIFAPLTQLGALGILALILILAVRVLFARETKTLDIERARNAELAAELRKLNETIQDRILITLGEANHTMARALEAIQREGRG